MDISGAIQNNHLRVKVRPGARVSSVLKVEENIVHLAIAAKPEDGKANAEVERFLTRSIGRTARIKSGFANKEKLVYLE